MDTSSLLWGILIGWIGTSIGGAFILAIVIGGTRQKQGIKK